jgi:hypothetical protein
MSCHDWIPLARFVLMSVLYDITRNTVGTSLILELLSPLFFPPLRRRRKTQQTTSPTMSFRVWNTSMERASHDPFETSKVNLAYLFESNCEYLENASEDAMMAATNHKQDRC